MIVVVDTSALVSAVLKADGITQRALARATAPSNQLIVSLAVVVEYRAVLMRAKFDRISREHRLGFLDDLMTGARFVSPSDSVRECHDPSDDKFLSWPKRDART